LVSNGTLASGQSIELWLRWTACFRRVDGVWLVVHDHVSVPADLAHGKAVLNLTPWGRQKTMNTALWVLQGLLAFAFLASGTLKLVLSKDKLAMKYAWAEDFSATQVKLIGLAEVLGAVGLVVPTLTGIAPMLTPLAAASLVAIMIGAVMTHVRRKEPPTPPIVLGILAAIVAVGRFAIVP
jgi:hypothetical protein